MSESCLLQCDLCKNVRAVPVEEFKRFEEPGRYECCYHKMAFIGYLPSHCLLVADEKPEPVCRICGGPHLGLGLCRECCVFLNEAPKDGSLAVLDEVAV